MTRIQSLQESFRRNELSACGEEVRKELEIKTNPNSSQKTMCLLSRTALFFDRPDLV